MEGVPAGIRGRTVNILPLTMMDILSTEDATMESPSPKTITPSPTTMSFHTIHISLRNTIVISMLKSLHPSQLSNIYTSTSTRDTIVHQYLSRARGPESSMKSTNIWMHDMFPRLRLAGEYSSSVSILQSLQ